MTQRPSFTELLHTGWMHRQSMLCVGLDPDFERLPATYLAREKSQGDGVLTFCCDIADATADLVCAFKPQIAYFAALGKEDQLRRLIDYLHEKHPGVAVILDAKRGDIGSTARLYAVEAFERYAADAVTVNPYLGSESVQPYLEYQDRGVIVLCRTSNADSAWLQNYPEDEPVYLRVARAAVQWNSAGNVMLVAGATYPEELARIREVVGDMPLLVPGVGAQGGDLAAVVQNGADSTGHGLVINASRSVLYAGEAGGNLAANAHEAAAELRDEISRLQAEITPDRAVV